MPEDAHEAFRRRLEQRYGFARWAARARAGPPLRFAADPRALPGVRLEERSALPDVRGHIDHLASTGEPGGRVAVTVVEHADAAAAHESLLDLLGNAMIELLPSCEERDLEIGDVCYCNPGDPIDRVWFARANVLVRVESVGERPLGVADLAAALDRQIGAAGAG